LKVRNCCSSASTTSILSPSLTDGLHACRATSFLACTFNLIIYHRYVRLICTHRCSPLPPGALSRAHGRAGRSLFLLPCCPFTCMYSFFTRFGPTQVYHLTTLANCTRGTPVATASMSCHRHASLSWPIAMRHCLAGACSCTWRAHALHRSQSTGWLVPAVHAGI
jgi:hypothetical protein